MEYMLRSSCDALFELRGNRLEEILVGKRLGDITVTACRTDSRLITLHRQCSERDDWNVARRDGGFEQSRRAQPIHARQLNVHQNQIRLLGGGESKTCFRV